MKIVTKIKIGTKMKIYRNINGNIEHRNIMKIGTKMKIYI